jgi:hypothetical protein
VIGPVDVDGVGPEGNAVVLTMGEGLGFNAGADATLEEDEEEAGIWDLNGDLETRFVLFSLLNVLELRLAI